MAGTTGTARPQGRAPKGLCAILLILAALGTACGPKDPAPKRAFLASAAPAGEAVLDRKGQVISPMLDALWARQSILAKPSTFAQIADATLTASRASAEAQLRVKRLTAKSRARNWLPKLGPDVSLTSLTSIAASLVMDQAIFDRGKREAERDFVAADVELAALDLVEELNQRVFDALKLHIAAERATEMANLTESGIRHIRELERVTALRREGGLSDGAEYQVIAQRRAEAEASLLSWRDGEAQARAELASLTNGALGPMRGLNGLKAATSEATPLALLTAQAQAARQNAEMRASKSGLLAGLGAGAKVGDDGDVQAGLSLQGDILNFGRGDQLAALAAHEEVAARSLAEVRRQTDQKLRALDLEINNLTARQKVDAAVVEKTAANMGLYTEQYKAGRRSIIDLSGQYEGLIRLQIDHASLRYQIALLQLERGLIRGVLVDGKVM